MFDCKINSSPSATLTLSPMNKDPADILPNDILDLIFSSLSINGLSCSSMVSKKWKILSENNPIWMDYFKVLKNCEKSDVVINFVPQILEIDYKQKVISEILRLKKFKF